jgi:putative ABC transport system substrate-binding protein
LGWIEGRNLVLEERWTEGRNERLPSLIREVLERDVDVLVTYSTPGAVAAKSATATVPIVVPVMGDPVATGRANSLASPGHNVTGLSLGVGQGFSGKWLELAQETVPKLKTVVVLTNPDHPLTRPFRQDIEAIAPTRGLKTKFIEVREPAALETVFQQARQSAQAVLVLPGSLTFQNRRVIAALAIKYRLPSIYANQESVEAGGLMAYGVDFAVVFRRAADYVDKILKGAKPAELPIEEPTQFRLAINLKTAKALGLTIPDSVLLRADEVVR